MSERSQCRASVYYGLRRSGGLWISEQPLAGRARASLPALMHGRGLCSHACAAVCCGLRAWTDILRASHLRTLPLQLSLSQLSASSQSLAPRSSSKAPPQPQDIPQSQEGPEIQTVSVPTLSSFPRPHSLIIPWWEGSQMLAWCPGLAWSVLWAVGCGRGGVGGV